MKKKYIQPTTDVIQYNLCQPMFSGSIPLSDTTDTDVQFAPEGDTWVDKAYSFGGWDIE